MLPVWLLDVDGVVNANRPGWGGPPQRSDVWSPKDQRFYRVRWAPELVRRIRELHLAHRVEVRWCTTWCHEAHLLEHLWRLPALVRAVQADPMPRGNDCWPLKLAAAREVLMEGHPLIWTDDEALPSGPAYEELVECRQLLLIAPQSNRGLQRHDLESIVDFIDFHARQELEEASPE